MTNSETQSCQDAARCAELHSNTSTSYKLTSSALLWVSTGQHSSVSTQQLLKAHRRIAYRAGLFALQPGARRHTQAHETT